MELWMLLIFTGLVAASFGLVWALNHIEENA